MAEEAQAQYESYLRFTAKGMPFIVVLLRPELEEIFFESPEVLAEMMGKPLDAKDIPVGKAAPKVYLTASGVDWLTVLPGLTEQHLQQLRAVEPIAKLRDFLTIPEPAGRYA